jgi:hypothetical protein
MGITRVGKLFNWKGQKGVLDVSRSKGYRDLVLTNPANPYIPGTTVRRLKLIHLGPRTVAVADAEIERVTLALQDVYADKATAKNAPAAERAPPEKDGRRRGQMRAGHHF